MERKLVSIDEAVQFLGVTTTQRLLPDERIRGGDRRYDLRRLGSESTKNAPQMSVTHLGKAFKHCVAGAAEYPTFKKKARHDRFTLTNDQFTVQGRKGWIPKLGWVRMHASLRLVGEVLGGTISGTADQWFLRVTVGRETRTVVGVDLGVSALATLSTGDKIVGPKAYAAQKTLRRLSHRFSRLIEAAKVRAGFEPGELMPQGMPIPPSKNIQKTQRRIARLHVRIANILVNALHQLTANRSCRPVRCHRESARGGPA